MHLTEKARLWNTLHGIKLRGPTISHHPPHNADYNWRQNVEPQYIRMIRAAVPVGAIGMPQSPNWSLNQEVWCKYHSSSGDNKKQYISLGNTQGPQHFQGLLWYRCQREGHLARNCFPRVAKFPAPLESDIIGTSVTSVATKCFRTRYLVHRGNKDDLDMKPYSQISFLLVICSSK